MENDEIILFNSEYDNELDYEFILEDLEEKNNYNTFIICGYAESWDRRGSGYYEETFINVSAAINKALDVGMCFLTIIKEGNKLLLNISHHDGSNALEIRKLTQKGEEMDNNYYCVGEILNQENTTTDFYNEA